VTTSRRPRAVDPGLEDVEVRAVRAPVVQPADDVPVAAAADAAPSASPAKPGKRPLYPRLLRLRHIHPNAWQRAALGEGAIGVGVLLAMADLASAWTILALPVAVAAIVKAHDALQGLLDGPPAPDA
jgi:hypothetical protein